MKGQEAGPLDLEYMLRALALSKQALPECRPNPPVGCVIVKHQEILSQGFTQGIGCDHAEANALANHLGPIDAFMDALMDATVYVTLEPCSFVGRTPSCAHTLAQTGVARVVVAMLDPDTRNNGAGIKVLQEAGVSVEVGLGAEQVKAFLQPYLNQA